MLTFCNINISNLRYNYKQIKKMLDPGTKIMGVVKADAYGHGAVRIANELQDAGIDYLAVASLDEALELRQNKVNIPILLFGRTSKEEYEAVIDNKIDATVFDYINAKELNEYAVRKNAIQNVHIKFDTGMGRLGMLPYPGFLGSVKKIALLSNIKIIGIYSHFSVAEKDPEYTKKQFDLFSFVIKSIEDIGINIEYKHICNSAATLLYPQYHLNMIRTGIALYGLYPSKEIKQNDLIDLKEVMSLKTKISLIKKIEKPSFISYGNTYKAKTGENICTLPIGYADGLPRILSNKMEVLIKGKRCRSAGTICMDYMVVSCDFEPKYDDEVVILGEQGDEAITIDELAEKANTINYEIITGIGKRYRKIYIKE